MTFERPTKTAVIASALGAAIFGALQAGRDLWVLPVVALLAGGVAYAAGRTHPERATAIVLGLGYLTPAFFLLVIGYRFQYLSLWIPPFAGALAATTRSGWQYPARLRFPLVAWALAIAFTWPIVVMRVLDWTPSALWTPRAALTGPVEYVPWAVWVSQAAAAHLLGLLWFDWLCGRFADDKRVTADMSGRADMVGRVNMVGRTADSTVRFEQLIIRPLLAAAILAALVAVYQGFVDPTFLDIGIWAAIGRTSGSLADANASGALTALWAPMAFYFAMRGRSSVATIVCALSGVVLIVSTWVTGSRTDLLCALVGLGAFAHMALSGRANVRKLVVAAIVSLAVLLAAGTALSPSVGGPLRRLSEVLPGHSLADIRYAAQKLWAREGYGTAAMAMIADEPLQGVGVGAYDLLSSDYVFALRKFRIPPDNAQNWFRHQFAELGVLGSVGWIWWCVLLVAALVTRCPRPESHAPSLVARYTITGFGLASLLGMPSQNLFVALTVWTLAFWLLLMNDGARGGQNAQVEYDARRPLKAALILALVFTAATAYAAWRELRPPYVAMRLDAAYEYGLYQSMQGSSGGTQTSRHALTVLPALTSTLRLTLWVEHPDADTHPVSVDVWVDGRRLTHRQFPRNAPLTHLIPVPKDHKRFILETRVDRTFASPETKRPKVGLTMQWEFLESQ